MARLPSGDYLIQQIGDDVVLFRDHTEEQIARFDPADANAAGMEQRVIHESDLTPEDKSMAHFWSGYFYAHAKGIR